MLQDKKIRNQPRVSEPPKPSIWLPEEITKGNEKTKNKIKKKTKPVFKKNLTLPRKRKGKDQVEARSLKKKKIQLNEITTTTVETKHTI